ncbi:MAG: GAP family protein [Acidimicrobiia bacterium]
MDGVRQAIGEVLPLAIAAAISPFPIIGVVLMLVTPRARVNGPLFIAGWAVGLAAVGAIGLVLANALGASDDGAPSDGANTLQIVLGVLLIAFAVRQWRKRPKPGEEPAMPKWMDAVQDFTPAKAVGTGVVLSAVNPKNLILALSAAVAIATTDLSVSEQALAYLAFALVASLGVVTPVVVYFTMGDRADRTLAGLKTWLAHNNAAIMAVIFLVIGAKVLGQGIAG